eukprot:IDg23128t1
MRYRLLIALPHLTVSNAPQVFNDVAKSMYKVREAVFVSVIICNQIASSTMLHTATQLFESPTTPLLNYKYTFASLCVPSTNSTVPRPRDDLLPIVAYRDTPHQTFMTYRQWLRRYSRRCVCPTEEQYRPKTQGRSAAHRRLPRRKTQDSHNRTVARRRTVPSPYAEKICSRSPLNAIDDAS